MTCRSVLLLFAWFLIVSGEAAVAKTVPNQPAPSIRTGVRAEFRVEASGRGKSGAIREYADARVMFELRDEATGAPLKGLHPAAWLDLRGDPKPGTEQAQSCREKIQSFLQRGLGYRPAVDLNRYFILALNEEASISVIDPLLGFGSSKLLTTVLLPSAGADWALSPDRSRLFVALPAARKLAVVDTERWQVSGEVELKGKPTRIALQPDSRYLWVARQGSGDGHNSGGLSVIDTERLAVTAELAAGAGTPEFAFTGDSRYAFVSDSAQPLVQVIDVAHLTKLKELKLTTLPQALAYSALAEALYVGQLDGNIAVIDARKHEVAAFLAADPGLTVLRFSPGGRWGFAASGAANRVFVFDAATNQPVGKFPVGPYPDQIVFSDNYAYIRSRGTAQIGMIHLGALNKGSTASVASFSAGQAVPADPVGPFAADAISRVPEPNSMLVGNSGDKTIYYYSEGMAAPMGSFQNYGLVPRAIQVVDRSLRETAPGIYSTSVRFPRSGTYDVALLVENPRFERCFQTKVEPAPASGSAKVDPIRIEYLLHDRTIPVGQPVSLQFRISGGSTPPGTDGFQDVEVQLLASPGNWNQRTAARPLEGGIYEAQVTAPRPGVYYVFVKCPSQGIRFEQLPSLILRAVVDD